MAYGTRVSYLGGGGLDEIWGGASGTGVKRSQGNVRPVPGFAPGFRVRLRVPRGIRTTMVI